MAWGADMRHFTARGIPCTMAGTPGIELAHAVDERLPLTELTALARATVRLLARASAFISLVRNQSSGISEGAPLMSATLVSLSR